MNRLVYFLMVGLAFTVLQVSTVAAQTGDPCMAVPAGPDRDACYATAPAPGMAPPTGDPAVAPPAGQ